MAVGFSFRVDVRPYSGYDDPSLPIAAWVSQAGAAGDASGGSINMDVLFHRDGDPQTSELYNLEQIAIDVIATGPLDGSIQSLNMDNLAPNRPLSDQLWSLPIIDAQGSFSALDFNSANVLPLWLGAPNRDIEGDSGIRFFFNNVNNRLIQIITQGFIWGPRSILAPGGPQRPVSGFFGP